MHTAMMKALRYARQTVASLTGVGSQSAVFNPQRIQSVMRRHNLPPVICRVLFAAILSSTTLFVRGDELTGTPPSSPAVIGTEITANLVNIALLFDRVASNPPRATSQNYLARVSKPSFALYPD
jgi:hypothetical protein